MGGPGPPGPPGPKGDPGVQGAQGAQGSPGPITWGDLSEEQRKELLDIMSEDPDFKGPPGENAVPDVEQVIVKLRDDNKMQDNLINRLSINSDFAKKIGQLLNDTRNTAFMTQLTKNLSETDTFIDKMENRIQSSTTLQNLLRGKPGDIANEETLNASMKTKTIWGPEGTLTQESRKVPNYIMTQPENKWIQGFTLAEENVQAPKNRIQIKVPTDNPASKMEFVPWNDKMDLTNKKYGWDANRKVEFEYVQPTNKPKPDDASLDMYLPGALHLGSKTPNKDTNGAFLPRHTWKMETPRYDVAGNPENALEFTPWKNTGTKEYDNTKKVVFRHNITSGNTYVGINTNNPQHSLDVVGGGGANIDLNVNGRMRSNNNDGGLWIASDRFVGGHSTNKVGIWNNNAWRMTVQDNGNVGVGTANPQTSLHVNGSVQIGSFVLSDVNNALRIYYRKSDGTLTDALYSFHHDQTTEDWKNGLGMPTNGRIFLNDWKIQPESRHLSFFQGGQLQVAMHRKDTGDGWANNLWARGPISEYEGNMLYDRYQPKGNYIKTDQTVRIRSRNDGEYLRAGDGWDARITKEEKDNRDRWYIF